MLKAYSSSTIPLIAWSCRMIPHFISGGGKGMKGYDALDCIIISRDSAGARLGRYSELCFLPDKAARVLFEFNADDYKGLRRNSKICKQLDYSQSIENGPCLHLNLPKIIKNVFDFNILSNFKISHFT
jgi:hypothetical protein